MKIEPYCQWRNCSPICRLLFSDV